MTDKRKKSIRELAAQLGVNRRVAASRLDQGRRTYPSGAIEVLVFDPGGRQFHGIVWFVPPGLPNGAIDPSEGLIMGGIPALKAGPYLLVEATGRVRHIRAERSAGGGAFMAVFTEPDSSAALQIAYASSDADAHGMPTTFARYKIIPDRNHFVAGVYAMGIMPLTDGATVKGLRTFGSQAWRELFALLHNAHPDLAQQVFLEGGQAAQSEEVGAFDVEAHAKMNDAVREAARVRGEVQARVLKVTPTDGDDPSPTTQADLGELAAADRTLRDLHEAQVEMLRATPPPPGADQRAFEVIIPSGSGTVTVLRGATLATAHAHARHEAKARRKNVYIRNTITGVTQPVGPPKQ